MDGIQQLDLLDGPHGSRSHCWIWYGYHLHAGMELPPRFISEFVSHAFIPLSFIDCASANKRL